MYDGSVNNVVPGVRSMAGFFFSFSFFLTAVPSRALSCAAKGRLQEEH